MKKIRVIRKDSGLKSGSREVSLTAALKYPIYSPVQGKDVSHEALKLSNIRFNIRFKKKYLSQSPSSQKSQKGPKRVCCTSQLKHRHPASTAQKYITWGLGHIRTIATPLDRRKATREVTWGLFASQRTKSLHPCNRLSSQAWKPGVRT